MKRHVTLAAALAVATAELGTGLSMSTAAVPAARAAEDQDVRNVEGRVVDVRPEGNGGAELRLEDGTRLTFLASEPPAVERPTPGARVEAQYRKAAGDNVVIHLRVMPDTQAP